ncbi:major facilitator superfamily domain-containing protein [Aspergillus pseudotamarii]|uniref:Major facilitator superfamily domain-containing protein n=1 Tax=Aspergillus pseudotamarii TaxID=132259 RepID=A0A5N6T5C5_ASPPS|nr:major facilitator superfamily domain-containing protein [Aspergillus pseudotamarii]KAE8141391.1 major facilitator superfamily domain-containing protein [Aspergillus pseudotamarii]
MATASLTLAVPGVCIRRWFSWHEPNTTKEEKWLIFKLDFFILLYTCLTSFVKYLVLINTSHCSAVVNAGGNELNWFTTFFNIGIIIGAPFFTAGLTVIHPRYWLPTCTLIWSLLVLFMYKAESVNTIYILRFFAGFFESGAMPGAFYIIGSWYRLSEIYRRSTIFMFSSAGGQMFSGYIQSGLYRNMNNRLGLAAWRWVFIFDCLIGIPIAVFGLLCCPDEPKSPRMWWMTENERQMSIERLADEHRDAIRATWDLHSVKRVLSSWQLYSFCIAWGAMECTGGVNLQRWMALYLKSLNANGYHKYSIEDINNLPTVELAWMLLSALVVDRTHNPSLGLFGLGVVQLFSYIVFLVWSSNNSLMMAAYYLCSAYGAMGPLISAWLNSSCGGDKQLRALTTSLMMSLGYAVGTVSQQFMFPTSEAPRFQRTHGYAFGVAWVIVLILWLCIVLPLIERHFNRPCLAATKPLHGRVGEYQKIRRSFSKYYAIILLI